jgi:hypothetical protein
MGCAASEKVPRRRDSEFPGERAMKTRFATLLLLLFLLLALGACASSKASRQWNPGDTVICPHCGREFTLPEKMGK